MEGKEDEQVEHKDERTELGKKKKHDTNEGGIGLGKIEGKVKYKGEEV